MFYIESTPDTETGTRTETGTETGLSSVLSSTTESKVSKVNYSTTEAVR